MPFSIFELFKIGIGPSSSHTVGPMVAGYEFVKELKSSELIEKTTRIKVGLYGSLALTGKGDATDIAILLGLSGKEPDKIDSDKIPSIIENIRAIRAINICDDKIIPFNEKNDLIFHYEEFLPHHSNGMEFCAFGIDGDILLKCKYYSIGGGFIAKSDEYHNANDHDENPLNNLSVPFAFKTAKEMLLMGKEKDKTIAEMVVINELTRTDRINLFAGLDNLRNVMRASIDRGMSKEGALPGGLNVKRRARNIHRQLMANQHKNQYSPHNAMDWVSLYAIAVNEENAAGGQVVTAPTNGAAGILPAVLRYYEDICPNYRLDGVYDFLFTATAIGSLIKLNASISGAEVGCQGEVGSACAMAAAGMAAAFGATNEQITNAAEIAIEHHLGMTCDPIGGLVQVPCIERNAMGAVKAINAASLAMKGDGTHFVSLDDVIRTMRDTGKDMHKKYKETSTGGLAVNVVEC